MDTKLTYTDQELVRMLTLGDRHAFETIYNRYWTSLYVTTFKRLADKEQTEDILQEVFASLWKRKESLVIENLGGYLATSVRYAVIHYINRNKNALFFYQPFEEVLMEMDTPEEKLIAKEMLDLVYQYAETLPKKRKAIFLMHIKGKLSTREIADELDLSQKTVQNQLGTALTGLKTRLTPVILAMVLTHL